MEPTLADLQAQIDQLSLVVAREREAPGSPEALEQLTDLTERCREILKRWTDMDERHSDALGEVEARLGEWSAIEGRLERDAADRLRALEQSIEREWRTLKDIHEAPAQQLRDQANALSQTSMAAANLSLQAFERTEARLAALEADLHARLGQLAAEVHAALEALRRDGGLGSGPLPGPVAPFPLDGIIRIHEEHRDGTAPPPAEAPAGPATFDMPGQAASPKLLAETSSAWSNRLETLEREVAHEHNEVLDATARTDRLRREGLVTAIVVAVLLGISGFVGYRLERDVSSRMDDASAKVNAAEEQAQTATETATKAMATMRADADRQIADARETARRAEVTSTVLAAPDLVRLALDGTDATGHAAGQGLFSRSTGLVITATHVAAPPTGSTYQVWLLGATGAASVGFLVPDASGRAVFALDTLPDVPRPVTGVMVTVEPTGGKATPVGPVLLARPPQ